MLYVGLVVFTTGCTTNLTRFDIVHRLKRAGGLEVSRHEVGAQGSGAASGNKYSVERVTVGGSYLRRTDVSAGSGGHLVAAGLHGNPDAIE